METSTRQGTHPKVLKAGEGAEAEGLAREGVHALVPLARRHGVDDARCWWGVLARSEKAA
eukprot:3787274-Pleurochrysis_carterae.AAC.1